MIRSLALLLSALVGCTPAPPRLSVPDEEPPDTVILVVGCTLRADRTNVHGGPRNTTPYLQKLAEGGAHFSRVIANSGWTRPTIGAITTGAHPVSMGLDHGGHRAIDPAFTTLGERFTDAGWTTVGITANPNANPVFGFDQGFAQYQGTEALFRDGLAIRPGTDIVDDFADMIEDVEGPLFGQVVFLDAHHPWANNYGTQLLQGHFPSKRRRDLYDAALVDLDEAIAALDARLAELGRSNRLIMVIGDHGQGLRTPRWAGTGHGTVLYDAHTHVPWVVHGPGVAPGHELGGLAQQLDVVPTLMSMAGLQAEEGLEGVDHSAAIAGAADSTPPARILSASRVRKADEIRLTTDDWTVFRARGQFKRRRNVPHELFATTDTTQADDLAADEPELLRQLLLEAHVRWKTLDDAAIVVKVDVDTDQQDLLKELGYLDGDEEHE